MICIKCGHKMDTKKSQCTSDYTEYTRHRHYEYQCECGHTETLNYDVDIPGGKPAQWGFSHVHKSN